MLLTTGEDGMLVDLAKQHFVIVRAICGDRLTGGRASHKVDTLALQLKLLAYNGE